MKRLPMLNKVSIFGYFILFIVFFFFCAFFASCNVTRRVTTESSYLQRGDTSVTITVRTVETYDAKKNPNL